MKKFNFFHPTDIRFGRGRMNEVGEAVRQFGKRCLLVTSRADGSLSRLYRRVKMLIESAGVAVVHFDGVVPNPTTDIVAMGAALARKHQSDVVLGLGGGSSIDVAKAIAVEATHDGSAWEYLFFRKAQPTEKTLPIVVVTTTSGSGSHATQIAIITNPQHRSKSTMYHYRLFPKVSIVDPELTLSLSSYPTAVTGFDVFTHAFESYLNPNGSPYTSLLAIEAMRLTARFLPVAVSDGSNMEARTRLAWADTLAGICISNAGTTLPHSLAMAIGGMFPHIRQGEALAAVYPETTRYSSASALTQFATTARILDSDLGGEDDEVAALKACETIDAFLKDIGMWFGLEKFNIPEEDLPALVDRCMGLPDYQRDPRVATKEEMLELCKKSMVRA